MGAPSQRTQRTQVIPGTCNPRWNSSMQFFVRNLNEDVLCLTVYDKDYFAPNGNDKSHILKLRFIDTIKLLQIKNLITFLQSLSQINSAYLYN